MRMLNFGRSKLEGRHPDNDDLVKAGYHNLFGIGRKYDYYKIEGRDDLFALIKRGTHVPEGYKFYA